MILIQKYTKPDPSAVWGHEESAELADDRNYGDQWFLSRIREDLGESVSIQFHDMTAQFTLTVPDAVRADTLLTAMSQDTRLQEIAVKMAKRARRLGFEQLMNSPDDPDVYFDPYDFLVSIGLITD